jgi:hypothetical protein
MGACFPGNELRNAGRQESRRREESPAESFLFLPAFLPSSFHPGSLPTANVPLRGFAFRVRARRDNPRSSKLVFVAAQNETNG